LVTYNNKIQRNFGNASLKFIRIKKIDVVNLFSKNITIIIKNHIFETKNLSKSLNNYI